MNALELRDIHLPNVSLWWLPAPGWWFLLLLLVIAVIAIPYLLKWLRFKPIKTSSLRELNRIRNEFKQGQSEKLLVREISALMRRTLISYQGRESSAAVVGESWTSRLNQLAAGNRFSSQQLQYLGRDRYRRDNETDIDALLETCDSWFRNLPRSGQHVSD